VKERKIKTGNMTSHWARRMAVAAALVLSLCVRGGGGLMQTPTLAGYGDNDGAFFPTGTPDVLPSYYEFAAITAQTRRRRDPYVKHSFPLLLFPRPDWKKEKKKKKKRGRELLTRCFVLFVLN
jgi:hypothetical protein